MRSIQWPLVYIASRNLGDFAIFDKKQFGQWFGLVSTFRPHKFWRNPSSPSPRATSAMQAEPPVRWWNHLKHRTGKSLGKSRLETGFFWVNFPSLGWEATFCWLNVVDIWYFLYGISQVWEPTFWCLIYHWYLTCPDLVIAGITIMAKCASRGGTWVCKFWPIFLDHNTDPFCHRQEGSSETIQGLGLMSLYGDFVGKCPFFGGFVLNITKPNVCWRWNIPIGWCETLGHQSQALRNGQNVNN